MSLAEEFYKLFEGSELAHGTFEAKGNVAGKTKGEVRVLRNPATVEMWETHLAGGLGLGVIPIRKDNTCTWGAIDIDDYKTDHKALIQKLKKAGVPAVVGRSKSGGAHIWVFLTDPVPAATMKAMLASVAEYLQVPESEIFPKQSQILADRGDTGNFINMPYHNDTKSMRYAFDDEGNALKAEEFIPYARSKIVNAATFKIKKSKEEHFQNGPPCLQHLASLPEFPLGSRNNALFSMGVYCRKRYAEGWEDEIRKANERYFSPPGTPTEVDHIIQQLQKKDYGYKCNEQPIVDCCIKDICKTRKYGVGFSAPEGIGNLTKIEGDPPFWILDVYGGRVEIPTDALMSHQKLRKLCMEQINQVIEMTSSQWGKLVKILFENLTVVEARMGSRVADEFQYHLTQFCSSGPRSVDEQLDVLRGNSVWLEDKVFFQIDSLKNHFQVRKFDFPRTKLTQTLKELGGEEVTWKIGHRHVTVWGLPQSLFPAAEEAPPLPDFPPLKDVI